MGGQATPVGEWTCELAQRYSPVTQGRVPWIGTRQWGRDSSDAHATSRQSLITSGGRATLMQEWTTRYEIWIYILPVSFARDPGKGVLVSNTVAGNAW
jgi:hypothetical protein